MDSVGLQGDIGPYRLEFEQAPMPGRWVQVRWQRRQTTPTEQGTLEVMLLDSGGGEYALLSRPHADALAVRTDWSVYARPGRADDGAELRVFRVQPRVGDQVYERVRFQRAGEETRREASGTGPRDERVRAQMPGRIVRVLVAPGELVAAGSPLLIMEAMKMENELRAQRGGRVRSVQVSADQRVESGALLLTIGGEEA